MKPLAFLGRILALFLIVALTQIGGSQEATPSRVKQITDLEKQIQDLQAKLKYLKEAPTATVTNVPASDFGKAFAWRPIGPANMGGRITSLAVFEADPTTYYAATASGGLLKTTNNGSTFSHQFDRETTVSIGAVAVAATDRNLVWVGTGEANPRNSVSYGDGVYVSTDGGKKWQHKGLTTSFQIGKIIIHPKEPNTVYVAALGRLYGPGGERGVYKTTDGGKNWQRSLYIDDKTGVIDMVMHPSNPNIMIAAAWERQRDEFDSFRGDAKVPAAADVYAPSKVHAPGSGLYKTTDGGKNWKKLTNGLPNAKLGRVGLDWHRNNAELVFAVIDTDKAGEGIPPSDAFLGLQPVKGPDGVRVASAVEQGPAAKAGIAKGDLLRAIDGKELNSPEGIFEALRGRKPGDKIKLSITSGKDSKDIEVTLARRASDDPNQRGSLGLQVEETETNVFLIDIQPKGPADKVGLKVDDLLLTADGVKLDNARTLFKLLVGKKIGDTIKLVYQRGKETKEVSAIMEAPMQGTPERPYGGRLGGQRENVQAQQGPGSEHTGGIYKSTDGGDSWTRVNSLNERPFYFSVVRVDPKDEKIVYFLGVNFYRSNDGGKNFTTKDINNGLHSDHHDLWINPSDGRHMVIGTDGGLYTSYDRAATWEHLNHMALGQFYHVAVDNRRPYHVYGGLQDNGSWSGPSTTHRPSGPGNSDYRYVSGGDGFVCRVDPNDPDLIYAESQDGNMLRRNLRTGQSSTIRPKLQPGTGRYRFNWNTPFLLSHHNPGLFYCAGNFVFRSFKNGDDLRVVSPEITRTKRGSATALAESPRNADVLWVGSDDGKVCVTRDSCKTWTDVTDKLLAAGVPGPRWVSSIEASRAVTGRCYVVLDAHRSDDDEPYVLVTEDYGETWKSLRSNLPSTWSRVLREDIKVPDLLYVGTELGLFASVDRGGSWFKIHGGTLPTVAIHEVAQPTTAPEIVAATHGRSLWVLDVTTLRQLKPEHFRDTTALLATSPLTRWRLDATHEGMFKTGTRQFVGKNPPREATIDFILAKKPEQVSLKITDVEGKTVREFDLSKEQSPGFHRIAWDLTPGTLKKDGAGPPTKKGLFGPGGGGKGGGQTKGGGGGGQPGGGQGGGRFGQGLGVPVTAGTYRVQLEVDGQLHSRTLTLTIDPRTGGAMDAEDEAEEERLLRRAIQGLQPLLDP